jgi:phage baseplate assembly protein gpV
MPGIAESLGRLERDPSINLRYYGVVTARVSAIQDNGLYEVEYLHMGNGEASGGLARVMAPGAGGQRGCYFFPEVGDEVVIAFEMGNPDLPIILGGVFNNVSPPPDQAEQSTDNDRRCIVSRVGHEVTFDDAAGGGRLIVKTKRGATVTLDDTGAGKVTVESAGGMRIEIDDGARQMTLDAGLAGTITLNAAQVNISALGGIGLTTTGVPGPGSLVKIDNASFGNHLHELAGPLPGLTGTVAVTP